MAQAFVKELGADDQSVVVSLRCGRFDPKSGIDCGRLLGNVRVVLPAEGVPYVFDISLSRRLGRGQAPLPGTAVVGNLPREGITWDTLRRDAGAVTFRCARCRARPALSCSRLGAEAVRQAKTGPLTPFAGLPGFFDATLWIAPGGQVLRRPATVPSRRQKPLQANGSGKTGAVVKHRSARADVEVEGQQQTVAPAERELSGAWPTTTGG